MLDIAQHSYTQKSYQKWRLLYNIMGRLGRIKDEKRIVIQSQSCLEHNSLEVLKEIQCPTLVLGALEDDVIGVKGSKELAKAISGCQLLILNHSGHAAAHLPLIRFTLFSTFPHGGRLFSISSLYTIQFVYLKRRTPHAIQY